MEESKVVVNLKQQGIEQVVIGAQTAPNIYPKWDCFETIYQAAKDLKIPVFVKDNMESYLKKRNSGLHYDRYLAWRN